jgi:hypothetical protein
MQTPLPTPQNLRNLRRYKGKRGFTLLVTLDLVDERGKVAEAQECAVPENRKAAARCRGIVPLVREMIARGECAGAVEKAGR